MIERLMKPHNERALWFGIVATFAAALGARVSPTQYNNYVLFADALLHHRYWLVNPPGTIDAVLYRGHYFIVNDPVPGLCWFPQSPSSD